MGACLKCCFCKQDWNLTNCACQERKYRALHRKKKHWPGQKLNSVPSGMLHQFDAKTTADALFSCWICKEWSKPGCIRQCSHQHAHLKVTVVIEWQHANIIPFIYLSNSTAKVYKTFPLKIALIYTKSVMTKTKIFLHTNELGDERKFRLAVCLWAKRTSNLKCKNEIFCRQHWPESFVFP